jgi:hypothetical protein
MKRVLILVEGDTEGRIVKDVLVSHLLHHGVALQPTKVTTKRPIGAAPFKGGGDYTKIRDDLRRLLNDSNAVAVTTWFDFYGFPKNLPVERPEQLRDIDAIERSIALSLNRPERLFPYLQRHETEALLFVDPEVTARAALQLLKAEDIATHREGFDCVEDINLDPERAPSKRLRSVLGSFAEPQLAPAVLQKLGVETLRVACPRWGRWIGWLEKLGGQRQLYAEAMPWWAQ